MPRGPKFRHQLRSPRCPWFFLILTSDFQNSFSIWPPFSVPCTYIIFNVLTRDAERTQVRAEKRSCHSWHNSSISTYVIGNEKLLTCQIVGGYNSFFISTNSLSLLVASPRTLVGRNIIFLISLASSSGFNYTLVMYVKMSYDVSPPPPSTPRTPKDPRGLSPIAFSLVSDTIQFFSLSPMIDLF